VKLVVAEAGSEEARESVKALLREGFALCTVDTALAECLNAIWKHVKVHRDLSEEEAEPTIQDLTNVWDGLSILTTRELSEEAVKVALSGSVSIYDALYIGAARKLDATLYTADEKLHRASKDIAKSSLLRASPSREAPPYSLLLALETDSGV